MSKKLKNKNIKEIKNFISYINKFFDDNEIKIEKKWESFKEILNKKNVARKECLLLPFKTISKALGFDYDKNFER